MAKGSDNWITGARCRALADAILLMEEASAAIYRGRADGYHVDELREKAAALRKEFGVITEGPNPFTPEQYLDEG